MKLTDLIQGRDNNFNLIRIAAAYAVLVTHSFALALGTGDAEPLRQTLGMTLGSIAVDVFFLTSGFLVTASLLTKQDSLEFTVARVLRIFPGLLVMLLFSVFVIGLSFTTLSWRDYLTNAQTYKYFAKCLTLVRGVAFELPGVFHGNPYDNSINGSLWTLPNEVAMYLILVSAWVALSVIQRHRAGALQLLLVLSALFSGAQVLASHYGLLNETTPFPRLFFMFFSGAAFFVLRTRIQLSRPVFLVALALLIMTALQGRFFFPIYLLCLPYLLFYLAYVPSGWIRKYNRMGDYSYGIYIYAFPIQQSVAALIPHISVPGMMAVSTIVTLSLAAVSWHGVEQPALGLKHTVVARARLLAHPFRRSSR
ncbi:acyltransferase [Ideonella sp. B508-1]|uniref:acyltransferase family protein n=1 Tax=Ideonella sp. B508-1 TaxID=137716 RepID=UPI0003461B13|nr:acyltransferase [Ideonella sp. B508-1]